MSKESIIKDLPDAFVRQMRNWVITASGIGFYAISPAYEGMPNNSVYGSRVPSGGAEVSHVERALDALTNRERCAVMLFWQYEGNDLGWLGRRLGCDYRTAEIRVRRGHEFMRNYIAVREAAHDRMLENRTTRLV